jgi:K+-sensing histidine kinase KdpD
MYFGCAPPGSIERQGGRISVMSTPGRGATFAIRLPVTRMTHAREATNA